MARKAATAATPTETAAPAVTREELRDAARELCRYYFQLARERRLPNEQQMLDPIAKLYELAMRED